MLKLSEAEETLKRIYLSGVTQMLGEKRQAEDRHPTEFKRTTHTITRATPKTGRNDPCPCGSGKKHKHCCLKNGT